MAAPQAERAVRAKTYFELGKLKEALEEGYYAGERLLVRDCLRAFLARRDLNGSLHSVEFLKGWVVDYHRGSYPDGWIELVLWKCRVDGEVFAELAKQELMSATITPSTIAARLLKGMDRSLGVAFLRDRIGVWIEGGHEELLETALPALVRAELFS